MLSDIRSKLMEAGDQSLPPDSQFHLEKVDSKAELRDLDIQLESEDKKRLMVSTCMLSQLKSHNTNKY